MFGSKERVLRSVLFLLLGCENVAAFRGELREIHFSSISTGMLCLGLGTFLAFMEPALMASVILDNIKAAYISGRHLAAFTANGRYRVVLPAYKTSCGWVSI